MMHSVGHTLGGVLLHREEISLSLLSALMGLYTL
jgi:hypothetical protein